MLSLAPNANAAFNRGSGVFVISPLKPVSGRIVSRAVHRATRNEDGIAHLHLVPRVLSIPSARSLRQRNTLLNFQHLNSPHISSIPAWPPHTNKSSPSHPEVARVVRVVTRLSVCNCLRVVTRGVARVVRGVVAQVIENIAGGNSEKCGSVCLLLRSIWRRLLGRRARLYAMVDGPFLTPTTTPGAMG